MSIFLIVLIVVVALTVGIKVRRGTFLRWGGKRGASRARGRGSYDRS